MSTIKPSVAERFAQHVPYHRPRAEIERAAAALGSSPTENGVVEMIICRPARYERMVLDEGMLEVAHGLIGDTWEARGATNTPDGRSDPLRQVTVMNSRALASVAGERGRWELAGDQLIVDLDLSMVNLPAGTRLQIGEAVAEVTEPPHTGLREVRWPLWCRRVGLGERPCRSAAATPRHARSGAEVRHRTAGRFHSQA